MGIPLFMGGFFFGIISRFQICSPVYEKTFENISIDMETVNGFVASEKYAQTKVFLGYRIFQTLQQLKVSNLCEISLLLNIVSNICFYNDLTFFKSIF